MSLSVVMNGKMCRVEGVAAPAMLATVLEALSLRADRIAVELNGEIAPRRQWGETVVADGDRLEVVHFVGGGTSTTE